MATITATVRLNRSDLSDAEAQTWAEEHTIFDLIDKGEVYGPEVEPPPGPFKLPADAAVFLVAYTDDEGPYAMAFSRRKYAEAFAHEKCRAGLCVTTMIETEIDSPGTMVTARDGTEGCA